MTKTRIGVAGIGLALWVAGCNEYVYQPEENATAQMRGRTAAKYDVPQGHPQGEVRVASYGVAKVTPEKPGAGTVRAMHVRMVIENNSDQPWTVDTRNLRADLRGGGPQAAAFIRSDANDLPVTTVAPRGKRTINLFFPLPPTAQRAGKIPAFDFTWQVQAGGEAVAQRTPFERLNIAPYYAAYGPYWGGPYGWGPYSWYGPAWGPAVIGIPGWYW